MQPTFSLANGLALLFALICAGCVGNALFQFVIGQHYLIPTFWLAFAMLSGNFARYALAGARWAQEIVFWCGALASCTLFMGIFFAKTPKALLGGAFLPVWIGLFLALAFLTFHHARSHQLVGDRS